MFLFILSKANKAALVPVKRLVTKKGKPFMQTFYVRSDKIGKDGSKLKKDKLKKDSKAPKKIDYRKRVTDHIIDVIMGRSDSDSEERKALQLRVRGWVKKNIKTESEAQFFIEDNNANQWFEMEIAIDGDMEMDDAVETAASLAYINDNASNTYAVVSFDTVYEWWQGLGSPLLIESDMHELHTADLDNDDLSNGDTLSYMIDNNLTSKEAVNWQVENSQLADFQRLEDFEMTDSNGLFWDASDLQAIGEWVKGDIIKSSRKAVKEIDKKKREGVGSKIIPDAIGTVIETHMTDSESPIFYRGTKNPDWKKASVGESLPLGVASFSHDSLTARTFAKEGGTVIILENDPASGDRKVKGVDIPTLIRDVNAVDDSSATLSGINMFEREAEFIVRAPSLKITKVERSAHFNYVYAVITEMELLKSMSLTRAAILLSMESLFDEPLHRDPKNKD